MLNTKYFVDRCAHSHRHNSNSVPHFGRISQLQTKIKYKQHDEDEQCMRLIALCQDHLATDCAARKMQRPNAEDISVLFLFFISRDIFPLLSSLHCQTSCENAIWAETTYALMQEYYFARGKRMTPKLLCKESKIQTWNLAIVAFNFPSALSIIIAYGTPYKRSEQKGIWKYIAIANIV